MASGSFGSRINKDGALQPLQSLLDNGFIVKQVASAASGCFGSRFNRDGASQSLQSLIEKGFTAKRAATMVSGPFGSHISSATEAKLADYSCLISADSLPRLKANACDSRDDS